MSRKGMLDTGKKLDRDAKLKGEKEVRGSIPHSFSQYLYNYQIKQKRTVENKLNRWHGSEVH